MSLIARYAKRSFRSSTRMKMRRLCAFQRRGCVAFTVTRITRTRLTSFHAARRQPHAKFSEETDHLLTRVMAIEKHLGIDKKIAA